MISACVTTDAASAGATDHWVPSASAVAKPQILVLGTYHMANPDHDYADPTAPDDLTSERQAQLQQVAKVLERYRPTVVAVEESPKDNAKLEAEYRSYVAGTLASSRNEIEQVAFRVAKGVGLKVVYGVDAPRLFPFQVVRRYAERNHETPQLEAILHPITAQANTLTAYIDSHTILQALTLLNSDQYVRSMVNPYYEFAHFSKPGDWAGPHLVSVWFERNLRIYANVLNLIQSPQTRVLLVIGAGHLGWLRHDFASDPTVRLRTLADFLPPAASAEPRSAVGG